MAFGSRRSLAGGLSDNEDTTNRIWNMTEFDPEGTSNPPAAPDTPGQDREPATPFVFPPMPSPAVIRDSHRLSYRRSTCMSTHSPSHGHTYLLWYSLAFPTARSTPDP
eukprot:TRINITY_DN2958_c0_g2_i16.p1 TRINITY_DN2958_c0_g2~~TRINITY_DN2958_c0_g2_i16.p1  ORF type:complete len:108 (+),score=3.56 TRINITY_DN2958_c0_g2_i16:251-574(+)